MVTDVSCPVLVVQQLLASVDAGASTRFSAIVTSIATRSPSAQIDALNEFWRFQLGYLAIDTRNARYCLQSATSSHEIEMWLDNFRRYILPVARAYALPTDVLVPLELKESSNG